MDDYCNAYLAGKHVRLAGRPWEYVVLEVKQATAKLRRLEDGVTSYGVVSDLVPA